MIALNDISKRYGDNTLFQEVSLRIGDDERIAIVGSNGSGKSTLMKIIMGLVEPDSGEITASRSNTVGYLPQDGVIHSGRTLYEETAAALEDILVLHDKAEQIGGEINRLVETGKRESPEVKEMARELGLVQHHLEQLEGYSIGSRVEQVLAGLGFRERDFSRLTDEFSGGWQMRIALARLLLKEPTILMLDEPTNHLDLESLEWLESYLGGYKGTIILVSHDRRFLDNLVTRTIELSRGRMSEYRGNYSYYVKEKEERMAIFRAEFNNRQEQIKATMKFVERFRYKATKARQVQSRIRMLERMDLMEPEEREKNISFDFPRPPSPGRILMTLEHVSKSYGEVQVFRGLSLTMERGDRIAFLGVNGSGKSTLARIIAGLEPIGGGTRRLGHKVVISYYAQNQAEELDPGKTVLQTVEEVATVENYPRLRTLLGSFLFRGDEVFKRVSVLSGGEKSRLAIAKMLLTPANLLVLDEPTNHLDMRSKAILQEALGRFEGSYILVSHDRDFLDGLINRVAEFRNGKVTMHLGTVSDYLEKIHREREDALQKNGTGASNSPGDGPQGKAPRPRVKEQKRREAEKRQDRYRKMKPLKDSLSRVEREIAEAEKRKSEIEAELSSEEAYRNADAARALSVEYKNITTGLAYSYDKWSRIQEEIESLEGDG